MGYPSGELGQPPLWGVPHPHPYPPLPSVRNNGEPGSAGGYGGPTLSEGHYQQQLGFPPPPPSAYHHRHNGSREGQGTSGGPPPPPISKRGEGCPPPPRRSHSSPSPPTCRLLRCAASAAHTESVLVTYRRKDPEAEKEGGDNNKSSKKGDGMESAKAEIKEDQCQEIEGSKLQEGSNGGEMTGNDDGRSPSKKKRKKKDRFRTSVVTCSDLPEDGSCDLGPSAEMVLAADNEGSEKKVAVVHVRPLLILDLNGILCRRIRVRKDGSIEGRQKAIQGTKSIVKNCIEKNPTGGDHSKCIGSAKVGCNKFSDTNYPATDILPSKENATQNPEDSETPSRSAEAREKDMVRSTKGGQGMIEAVSISSGAVVGAGTGKGEFLAPNGEGKVSPLLNNDVGNGDKSSRKMQKDRYREPLGHIAGTPIIPRSDLFKLLRYLSEHYTLAVWTSATRRTARGLIQMLFPEDVARRLLFVWSQEKCRWETNKSVTSADRANGASSTLFIKKLSQVWEAFPLWDSSNSLLIDDSPEKCPEQFLKNTVHPPALSGFVDDEAQDEENQEKQMTFFIKLAEFWREENQTDQVAAASNEAIESGVGKNNQVEFLVSHGIGHMGWRGGCKDNAIIDSNEIPLDEEEDDHVKSVAVRITSTDGEESKKKRSLSDFKLGSTDISVETQCA